MAQCEKLDRLLEAAAETIMAWAARKAPTADAFEPRPSGFYCATCEAEATEGGDEPCVSCGRIREDHYRRKASLPPIAPAPDPLDALLDAAVNASLEGPWKPHVIACALRNCSTDRAAAGSPSTAAVLRALADGIDAHLAGKEPKAAAVAPAPHHVCVTCKHRDSDPQEGPCKDCNRYDFCGCGVGTPCRCPKDPNATDKWEPKAAEGPKCSKCGKVLDDDDADATAGLEVGDRVCEECLLAAAESRRVAGLRERLKPGMCVQHKDGQQGQVRGFTPWETAICEPRSTGVSVNLFHTRELSFGSWPWSDIAGILTLKGEAE